MKLRISETSNKRVLIIDDNMTARALLECVLSDRGYEIRQAKDGAEGLKIVQAWHPSVILVDLVMPGMDGAEVCRKIRTMGLPYRPSIIIVSVRGEKSVIADLLNNYADDFIVKPFNEIELSARVRSQMRICDFHAEIEADKGNLSAILEVTRAVNSRLDSSFVLDMVVKYVAEFVGADRCSIVLIVKENEGYVLASHDSPAARDLKINLSRYPEITQVISTKKELVISDMVNDPIMSGVKETISDLTDMSMLIVPVIIDDEVLATLLLRARRRDRGFTPKEVAFCKTISNASYHALANARMFEKVVREKEHLKDLAVKDQLTSLYNHNFFYSRLEEEFDRAIRYEHSLALLMVDVDDFKQINDTYGHRVGDTVLREIAQAIKKVVRRTDVVARYGGEEFAVILPHTLLHGAMDEAERLRALIENHAYANIISRKVTVSIGVAAFPQTQALTPGDLVNHADSALYTAKRTGKNKVVASEV